MSPVDTSFPRVVVKGSDLLDGIALTIPLKEEETKVKVALKHTLPDIKVRRTAIGLWIDAADAFSLPVHMSGIDLKWEQEALQFVENRQYAGLVHWQTRNEVKAIFEGGKNVAQAHLGAYPGLEALDSHQWVNVAAMTLSGGYGLCLFDEQGAGKTVSLIFSFDVLSERDEVDFALIVAPKSMVPEWQNDFKRFMGDMYIVETITGTRDQKRAVIMKGADVLVTNYETAVSMEPELRALLRRYGKRAMLVVDESFFVKNLNAKRTQALRRLREWCGRAFVLCGTPAPNSPHDLIEQFNIVDFGMTFQGREVPDDRAAAFPIVQNAIETRGIYIRHLKTDVLPELPIKQYHRVLLPLEPVQRHLYVSTLEELASELKAVDGLAFQERRMSFLAKRSALLQICSNPVAISDGYTESPAKHLALDGLLNELIGVKGEKVVLWSFYRASIESLVARYQGYGSVRYDGSVSNVSDRSEAVRKFQEDDKTMLFIGNPAAAGAGLTLHRARYAVYESMSNQAAHYLQSLDRIHRRGQTRETEYVILLCQDTIEVQEYERLIDKEHSSQELLRDDVEEPITRESMLAEMMALLMKIGEG